HFGQRHAGSGLGQVQAFGGDAHAAVQGHLHEDIELPRADVDHHSILYATSNIRNFVDRRRRPQCTGPHGIPMHATALSPTHPRTVLPGLALAAALAVLALLLGRGLPLIGGPGFGMVLGLLVRSVLAPDTRFVPGITFASTTVLQASIIALGFGLSLDQVVATGMRSLSVTVVTLSVAFFSAWELGRWLGVHDKLKVLVGVGTAICGASAIAAVTPIIRPDDHDTAFAISTILLFNIVAV